MRISSIAPFVSAVGSTGFRARGDPKWHERILNMYSKTYTEGSDPFTYHPLDDTAGMPVWHYNKTRGFARIRELSVANHATIRSAAYTGRLLTVFRYGGRAMFVAGGATSAFQIYKASNRVREASVQVSGWAGGIVGAKIGSGIGGRLGVALTVIAGNIGPQAVVPEEVVTVPASFVIGSGIGGIAGGVIGLISGVTVAEKVYDWAFTPGECDQYVICGEE